MITLFAIAVLALVAVRAVGAAGINWTHGSVNAWINAQNLFMHLYVNNITPVPNNVASDFTELTASGYSAKTMNGGGWTLSDDSTGTNGDYGNLTFTFTPSGSVTVYGYYVLDASNNFIGGEAFSTGAITFPSGVPASLVITPGVRAQGN